MSPLKLDTKGKVNVCTLTDWPESNDVTKGEEICNWKRKVELAGMAFTLVLKEFPNCSENSVRVWSHEHKPTTEVLLLWDVLVSAANIDLAFSFGTITASTSAPPTSVA